MNLKPQYKTTQYLNTQYKQRHTPAHTITTNTNALAITPYNHRAQTTQNTKLHKHTCFLTTRKTTQQYIKTHNKQCKLKKHAIQANTTQTTTKHNTTKHTFKNTIQKNTAY